MFDAAKKVLYVDDDPDSCELIDTAVPVIIYSAIARPVDREAASEAGVDLYLVKPDDLDRLKPAIHYLLGQKVNTSSAVSPG